MGEGQFLVMQLPWGLKKLKKKRSIQDEFRAAEEMLGLYPLYGTTNGTNTFEAVNKLVTGDSIDVSVLSL